MLEQWVYVILLALHNIALVLLSGGLFFMMNTWKRRLALGPDINMDWDTMLEEQSKFSLQLFLKTMGTVALTGFGFSISKILLHGKAREYSVMAGVAFGIKMLLVMILLGLLLIWAVKFVKPIKLAFEKAKKSDGGDGHALLLLNDLKNKRLRLIRICFYVTIIILIVTPILTYP